MGKSGIRDDVLEAAGLKHYPFFDQLAALPFVEAIYLYGSRARGDFDEWSDIDLLVDCPQSQKAWQLEEIKEKAEPLVDIDITRWQDISDDVFRRQVEAYRKLIYAKRG